MHLAWRGRWRRLAFLDFYLQEVAAKVMLSYLPTDAQHQVIAFASASSGILQLVVSLGAGPWKELLSGCSPGYSVMDCDGRRPPSAVPCGSIVILVLVPARRVGCSLAGAVVIAHLERFVLGLLAKMYPIIFGFCCTIVAL